MRSDNRLAVNAALALAYAGLGYLTLHVGQTAGIELRQTLWLPSGVALAVSLLVPYRVWPGTAVGAFAASLLDTSGLLFSVGTAFANGLEIGFATWLLRRIGFVADLSKPRGIVYLVVLAAGLAAAISALISTSAYVLSGGVPPDQFGRIWIMWWLTHGMGMLMVAPSAIALAHHRPADLGALRPIATILAAVLVATWIPFRAPPESIASQLFFVPLFLLLFAAIRTEMLGAALGTLIITVAAIGGAVLQAGPLVGDTPNETLFLTWSFVSVTIATVLVAAAVATERTKVSQTVAVGARRLAAVLDATGDGILVVDGSGRVTDVNRPFLEIAGIEDRAAQIGRPGSELLAELVGAVDTPSDGLGSLGANPTSSVRFRGEIELADGRWIHVGTAPLSGPGAVTGRIWSVSDITERVQSERERQRLQDQVLHAQKLEGLGVLAGGVAHDFNNLLMGITGYADLLRDSEALDAQDQADIESIIETAAHASELCGQMLTYAGKTTPSLAPVDVGVCVEDIRRLLSVSIAKSIDLGVSLPEEPLFALADEGQFRQVLLNLATNASEAVLTDGGSGSVWITARRAHLDQAWLDRALFQEGQGPGEYALVEVRDDGVGLAPASVAKIFDPFFSSKGTGRGLGLSSTLGVIRAHRGAIAVETELGGGATFTVALPLSSPAPRAEDVPSAPTVSKGHRTVLIVDDEAHVREVVKRMLAKAGYATVEAGDGDEALAVLEATPDIDLVLLDLTMPRRDGVSTLREMRERGCSVPVLVASGYSREALPEDLPTAGFVHKPFRRHFLLDTLEGVFSPDS